LGKNLGEKISPQADIVGAFFSADVQTALDHAGILFDGSEVAHKGLPHYLHIEKVLGWLAYAYDKRQSLHSPCGLVYSKLKDPSAPMPSMKYMKDPLAFFPDEYLAALGQWRGTCARCEQTFTDLAAYQAHAQECTWTPTEDSAEPERGPVQADATVTDTVWVMWQTVMARLEGETAKASFETWIKDAYPVHYEGGVLQVAARNAYARDWLGSRLGQRIGELAGCPVSFVVSPELDPSVATETEE
jgi:hypothetical protein